MDLIILDVDRTFDDWGTGLWILYTDRGDSVRGTRDRGAVCVVESDV